MSRHRKIDVRIWGDQKFRNLSAPQPCAQWLWVYLMTGPHTTSVPGISHIGEAALAEALGWSRKAFRVAFNELARQKMVFADWDARVIWIPNSIRYNSPESPNVVISWHTVWDEIPECDIKKQAYEHIAAFLNECGEAFARAWDANMVRHPGYKIKTDVMSAAKTRDKGRCRYCAIKVDWKNRRGATAGTYDHIDPTGPGTLENVVVACRSCNSQKGFRTPEQAGMKLIPIDLPRSDLGPIQVRPANQEQEQEQDQSQEQEQDDSPNPPPGVSDPFEHFWRVFPAGRKQGKGGARKAWDSAIHKTTPEVIIAAAAEYAASPVGQGRYVKGPTPWLNQECWSDDRAAWCRCDDEQRAREDGLYEGLREFIQSEDGHDQT